MGLFGFFVILGLIAFSTYKSSNVTANSSPTVIWGTIDKTIFDNYLDAYKQNESLSFNINYVYKSLDTIDGQLVEAIATGKAPDVILIPQTLEKRYLDKVFFIPVTSLPERTFTNTFVQESSLYIQPSGFFALPFFVDPLVMYWNKDMFLNADIVLPPSKWSDFQLEASKISATDNSGNINQSFASLGTFSNINNAKDILSAMILQTGNSIVSEKDNYFVSALNDDSSANVLSPVSAALQFFTDYSNPNKTVYSWNNSLPLSKQAFLSDNLAIYFGFASEYQDIKDKNPNLNFDVAVLPQILGAKSNATFANIYGFAILKTAQNISDKLNIILSLVSSNSISTLMQFINAAPSRNDIIATGSTDPVKTVFYNSAIISKGWIDPDINQTNKIFSDMISNITSGKIDISSSVTKASTEIDKLFK